MWKQGVTLATAREKVRVARALRDLPVLAGELLSGRVSYAQARAITRVASAADEQQWVDLARVTTAAQLERAVRGVRRVMHDRAQHDPTVEGTADQTADRHSAPVREALRVVWEDDGSLLLTVRVSSVHAPAVLARIEQAQQAEQSDGDALYARLARDLTTTETATEATEAAADTANEAGADAATSAVAVADVSAGNVRPAVAPASASASGSGGGTGAGVRGAV